MASARSSHARRGVEACSRRFLPRATLRGMSPYSTASSKIAASVVMHLLIEASVTRFILDRAKAGGTVRVWPIGAASLGSNGEAIAEIAGMKEAGIVAVSDDGKPIATAKLARQVMDYCRSLNLTVIEHAEDVSLAA
jgi:hypothetical protein